MKILFHHDVGPRLRHAVEEAADAGMHFSYCPEGPEEPLFSELTASDVLWHVLWPVDEDVLARAPRLRLIQKIGVGVNTIDLGAARHRNIAVCNLPGTNSQAVAEMTLLLMLGTLRHQRQIEAALRGGHWRIPDDGIRESGGELAGRTVGLIGFGAIPQILAPILEAMKARVIYTARTEKALRWDYLPLDQLLATADIVSLHLPLLEDTRGLINRRRIGLMKPGSILINTARGALVDEEALFEALASGRLAGAGLDVFAEEPIGPGHPLLGLPNVMASPHVAWLTLETWKRSIAVALENVRALRDGRPLLHRVI